MATTTNAAAVSQTIEAINETCRQKGGPYTRYSCKYVSWDDCQRYTGGGGLSCWGGNITDTRLFSKDGTQLYTVRPDNWNEQLGRVSAGDVTVVAGQPGSLRELSLREYLQRIGVEGGYARLEEALDLSHETLDSKCSIRFQTTFLPVPSYDATMEFATSAYNYNTTSDDCPKNLVLLCTTQGTAVQQDGAGTKELFHHSVDAAGRVHRHWLEAERSTHIVGGPQLETAEEQTHARRRGKATSAALGIAAMGSRFNALLTVQVPLQQEQHKRATAQPPSDTPPSYPDSSYYDLLGIQKDAQPADIKKAFRKLAIKHHPDKGGDAGYYQGLLNAYSVLSDPDQRCLYDSYGPELSKSSSWDTSDIFSCLFGGSGCRAAPPPHAPPRQGIANAARVSIGTEVDVWSGLTVKEPRRSISEHLTITVVMYNTITSGVPSEADVVAAIDDLERLYAACGAHGRLSDSAFDFMKKDNPFDLQAGAGPVECTPQ